MSQYNETGVITAVAGGALAKNLLVKLSAGKLAVAGLGEAATLGLLMEEAFAVDQKVPVRLLNKKGTMLCVAAGAFAVGAVVYGAAGGKVDDVAVAAVRIGIAIQAAAAANDVVEIMPD